MTFRPCRRSYKSIAPPGFEPRYPESEKGYLESKLLYWTGLDIENIMEIMFVGERFGEQNSI